MLTNSSTNGLSLAFGLVKALLTTDLFLHFHKHLDLAWLPSQPTLFLAL